MCNNNGKWPLASIMERKHGRATIQHKLLILFVKKAQCGQIILIILITQEKLDIWILCEISPFLSVSNKFRVFETLCQPNKNILGSGLPICRLWPKIYTAQRHSDLLEPAYTSLWLRVSHSMGIPFFFFFSFWTCCGACGILVPWPGIEPGPQWWKPRILTTRLSGNSQCVLFLTIFKSVNNKFLKII